MPGKKYNNEDIQRILKSAAERQQRDHARYADDPGLSLEELERIAAEAGIDPKYIREAARETSPTTTIRKESKFVGGVTDLKVVRSVPAYLRSDELAAELVPVIRDTMGKNGSFEVLGSTLSWNEGTAPSSSYTDVTVKSDSDETVISAEFTRNVKVNLYAFNVLPYFFAILTLIALTVGTELPAAIFFGLIFAVGAIISRFGLSRWSRQLADNLNNVVDDLEDKLLEAGSSTGSSSEVLSDKMQEDVTTHDNYTSGSMSKTQTPLIDLDDTGDPGESPRQGTRSKDRF